MPTKEIEPRRPIAKAALTAIVGYCSGVGKSEKQAIQIESVTASLISGAGKFRVAKYDGWDVVCSHMHLCHVLTPTYSLFNTIYSSQVPIEPLVRTRNSRTVERGLAQFAARRTGCITVSKKIISLIP